jgi:hypothetical protein
MPAQPKREDVTPHLDLVRATTLTGIDKEEVYTVDNIDNLKEAYQYDINSAEEVLSRYPLLRDKSEAELNVLNNRVKKLM